MEHAPPLITLTTDFGLTDPYVGQLKGVLLKGCPSATLVDITHAIPAWDILAAALALYTSYAHFPVGTVHLVVVDPGVGSSRSLLAAQGDGHFFVCPDNGILGLLLQEDKIQAVHRLEPKAAAETISPTFHGRDLMAPVAAALAQGAAIKDLGPALPLARVQRLELPQVESVDGVVQGQVLAVDHFGNVRTSIRCGAGFFNTRLFSSLEIQGHRITQLVRSYSEVVAGGLAVLVDSSGFLEIAANQASAAALIGCVPGNVLTMEFRRQLRG